MKRIVYFLFLSFFLNSVMGVKAFPDLSTAENFRKAQVLCDLTDYQSKRLYKLQYMYTSLSKKMHQELRHAVSEQQRPNTTMKRRKELHLRIGELYQEITDLTESFQHDVQELLTEEQFKQLFRIDSYQLPVLDFSSHDQRAYY